MGVDFFLHSCLLIGSGAGCGRAKIGKYGCEPSLRLHLRPTQFLTVVILYPLFIRLYVLAVRLAALWNAKARAWVEGRKDWAGRLSAAIGPDDRIIWVHCASAGELEQGKPLIEALKQRYGGHRILLSFFSPSGFAAGKKWAGADIITYLPADTRAAARRFVSIARPELVVFVKYEYWYYHLKAVADKNIPLLLVSAIFRPQQVFFKPYGGFFRKILFLFSKIFVQDEDSAQRLQALGLKALVAGDTRFDRVLRIAERPSHLPLVQAFAGRGPLIVAGSTWPEDEQLLAALLPHTNAQLVLAPHEMGAGHMESIRKLFPDAAFYSELSAGDAVTARVLVIDAFGLLSGLYQYAAVTYIGGGFNKSGIHNTLEAAVWSRPVLFGPNYQKFKEARDLVALGAAFSIADETELRAIATRLLEDGKACTDAGLAAGRYVAGGAGATQKILGYIQENRLLTS